MCGIAGLLGVNNSNRDVALKIFQTIRKEMQRRGPDAEGAALFMGNNVMDVQGKDLDFFVLNFDKLLYNARGIPPTESVYATQPVISRDAVVVHNGQLSNDKEFTKKYSDLPNLDTAAFIGARRGLSVRGMLGSLDGSRAIALYEREARQTILARDYLGLHIAIVKDRLEGDAFVVFSSEKISPLLSKGRPIQQEVYEFELPEWSYVIIRDSDVKGWQSERGDIERGEMFGSCWNQGTSIQASARTWGSNLKAEESAVVVLSGGLDSTVAATWAMNTFKTVHFIHYKYGARAQASEIKAVENIVNHFRDEYPIDEYPNKIGKLEFIDMDFLKTLGGSSLTDHTQQVVEGELAVEKATEWVPARNIAMIGFAASFCDRYNVGNIVLGLNASEGNVFSDNSKEFYRRMGSALSLGAHSRPKMRMPLGNMQKRHLYGYGLKIGAPIHLAWSCYHSGEKHCGKCGPCLQRKHSAASNKMSTVEEGKYYLVDSVRYLDESFDFSQGVKLLPKDFNFDFLIEDN